MELQLVECTNSVEQSPLEANSHLAPFFMENKDSLLCSQDPVASPYPGLIYSSPHPPTQFL
jgi:hypothetical protein